MSGGGGETVLVGRTNEARSLVLPEGLKDLSTSLN